MSWTETYYCCECGFGPHTSALSPACTICGHHGCPSCERESVENKVLLIYSHSVDSPIAPQTPTKSTLLSPRAKSDHMDAYLEILPGNEFVASRDRETFATPKYRSSSNPSKGSSTFVTKTPYTWSTMSTKSISEEGYTTETSSTYSCSSCSASPVSTETEAVRESAGRSWISRVAHHIVTGLIFSFDLQANIITCTTGGATPYTSFGSPWNMVQSGPSNQSSGFGNGQDPGRGYFQGSGGRDRDDEDREKEVSSPESDEDDEKSTEERFACPFVKHNPAKYRHWKECARSWSTIHRLKDHLYRCHRLYRCSRCCRQFRNSKTLVQHSRQDKACEKRKSFPAEGLNDEKIRKLKSRKGLNKLSNLQRWQAMYRIIFPDVGPHQIPSPFYGDCDDDDEMNDTPMPSFAEQLMDRCQQELAERVQSKVEEAVREDKVESLLAPNGIKILVEASYNDIVIACQRGSTNSSTMVSKRPISSSINSLYSSQKESPSICQAQSSQPGELIQMQTLVPQLEFGDLHEDWGSALQRDSGYAFDGASITGGYSTIVATGCTPSSSSNSDQVTQAQYREEHPQNLDYLWPPTFDDALISELPARSAQSQLTLPLSDPNNELPRDSILRQHAYSAEHKTASTGDAQALPDPLSLCADFGDHSTIEDYLDQEYQDNQPQTWGFADERR